MNQIKYSFDLTWVIVLFIVLKLTGVINLSWLWIAIPYLFFAVLCAFGAILGTLGAAIAVAALKNGKITIKNKTLDKTR